MIKLFTRSKNLIIVLMLIGMFLQSQDLFSQNSKPNIVLIYVDDLGYGDIGVNGAIGVETPNVDALAAEGMNFTDAHAPAATCTPSRYSLLTGSHAFRRKAAILAGDAPLLIDTAAETLPKMLKRAGYRTGVVGKWHLGLGNGLLDWNKRVAPGPNEVGFDYSFLIPATGDRVPCVFLENQYVVGLDSSDPIEVSYGSKIDGYPTGVNSPHLLKQHTDPQHLGSVINGISRIGYMKGGEQALWVDEDFPEILTSKAKSFMAEDTDSSFFLFFSLHDIHQPRIANIDFVESSSMGPRGDVIAQMDWCVGEVVAELGRLGVQENTLIIFTSDNGPVLDDGYLDYARELVGDHKPGGLFRGGKYSGYEAGTRVPTIVYWPGNVPEGTSDALVGQIDLLASLAGLLKTKLNDKKLDSKNQLDAWLGKDKVGREFLVEEAYAIGIRWNQWKYIPPSNRPQPKWITEKFIEAAFNPEPQLYRLSDDPGETKNLATQYPEVVAKLQKKTQ